jgi:hypothetical protein
MLPLGESQSLTLVLDERLPRGKRSRGFIQARQSVTRKSVTIRRLMPALDAGQEAAAIWARLINYAVTVAAQRGIERIFCCAAEASPEMAALASAGMIQYTKEDIYRLAPDTYPQMSAPPDIRPERSADQWNIAQLYQQITPRLVRQAESPLGAPSSDWRFGLVSEGQGEGFCLEDRTGIAGYGCLRSGRIGHWLSLLVHPRAADRTGDLLDYGLALLNYYPPYPVYCTAREYQGGIRAPLEDKSFVFYTRQCLLVRHILVRVKEPARSLVPGLEKRVEAPTTTVSPTEGVLD